MLHRISAKLATLKQDRGEGPVPYIVLVALVVAVAVFVGGALMTLADGWIGQLPTGP